MAIFPSTAIPSGASDFEIPYSCRFDGTAYLKRTMATPTSNQKFSFSFWFKRGSLTDVQPTLFGVGQDGNNYAEIHFHDDDYLSQFEYDGGYMLRNHNSAIKLRDPSAWMHYLIAVDSTQSTADDRSKIYLNGVEQTIWGDDDIPAEDHAFTWLNSANEWVVGAQFNYSNPFDGYLAEMHWIDGAQLTPASFGETGDYGEWKPIKVSGVTYGTNGFYLDFADAADLGDDESGEGNDFTEVNLAASDQMLDTPTNNFATVNPVFRGSAMSGQSATLYNYLAEGNLRIKPEHNQWIGMTIFPQTGKWYAEAHCFGTSPYGPMIGFYGDAYNRTDFNPEFGSMYKLYSRGASDELIWYAEPASAVSLGSGSGTAFDVDDIFGMAWDCDSGKMWISHNNTWYDASLGTTGNPSTGANPMATATAAEIAGGFGIYVGSGDEYGGTSEGSQMIMNFGQDSSFAGEQTAQGNQDGNGIGDFYYTPPTGFLALCTSNLPAVAVVPSEHFNIVNYVGDGTTDGSNDITGVGFEPDFVWIKSREAAVQHFLLDKLRGVANFLGTNLTTAQGNSTQFRSFDSDGFTVANEGGSTATNNDGDNFISWNWKAASTASGTTTGSGTGKAYSARYNTDAGFSMIDYLGNDTAGHTIPHHLSKAPELIVVKRYTNTDPWCVYHEKLHPSTPEQYADEWNAVHSFHDSTYWNDTAQTSSVFTVGSTNNVNANDDENIAYCWHSVDGYSKVGTYEGNNNADGTFVYTGFRPAYVWIKNIDASSNWHCLDSTRKTYNPMQTSLQINLSALEWDDAAILDFTSNGFKLRDTDNLTNNANTFIYFAIAETPFKYSNAR